jgi:hypothetical protein
MVYRRNVKSNIESKYNDDNFSANDKIIPLKLYNYKKNDNVPFTFRLVL